VPRVLLQTVAVALMNIRSIPVRWLPSLTTAAAIGGVVLMLVAALSIAQGLRAAFDSSGADNVAVIVKQSSTDEFSSSVPLDALPVIESAAGAISTDVTVSPELSVIADFPLKDGESTAHAIVRGVTAAAVRVRKHFRIVEGRMLRFGTEEIVVGSGAAREYEGLAIGQTVKSGRNVWKVVGRFEDGGSIAESEIWTDIAAMQGAFRRKDVIHSVRVLLPAAEDFDRLKSALLADPRVTVNVERETQFNARQWRRLRELILGAGWIVAAMTSLGAVIAALNTMYDAIQRREREIATLRAVGFGAAAVLCSVLLEALLLGAAGALLGGMAAYSLMNGVHTSNFNWENLSQVTFAFAVTPGVLATGVGFGMLLAALGGLPPSVAAVRKQVVEGLRD
jgi:putative ABC transport system permease protein